MSHPLRNHIDRLKLIRDRLAAPVDFYAAHQEGYREMAVKVTEAVLLFARPEEVPQDEWIVRIHALAAAVGSALINGPEVGLILWLDARQLEQQIFETVAPSGTFAKDTVLNWVRAGRAEDPLGKQLDSRDLRDSDETIAARVWWAMYTGRSRHAANHIREYLTGQSRDAMCAHLPAVLSAWVQTLIPAVRKDWREFVQSVIRKG